jgi:hypothetical protein
MKLKVYKGQIDLRDSWKEKNNLTDAEANMRFEEIKSTMKYNLLFNLKKRIGGFFLLLACLVCLQTCSEPIPEEYEINGFNAVLLEGKIVKELFYTGLAGNHFDRSKYIPIVHYLLFKNYSLKYRICKEEECNVCVGVPPGVMLRNPPNTVILIQGKESSFYLYDQCNEISFDRILFNPQNTDSFRYKRSGKYYIEPKLYYDILKVLRKEGVKKDFMEVVQYSTEELKDYTGLFAFGMFAAIFLIVGFIASFAMIKQLDEEEKERHKRY